MAQALLAHRLAERGIAAIVQSAGLLADGQPVTEEVVELMQARGLDVSGHVRRRVDAEMIGWTDLIVGMTREHVREASLLVPGAFGRTFTLKELVRRGTEIGPRPPDTLLPAWLVQLNEGRSPASLLGDSDDDDIADRMGRRFRVYRQVAAEIDDLTQRLVALLFPAEVGQSGPPGSTPVPPALDWS